MNFLHTYEANPLKLHPLLWHFVCSIKLIFFEGAFMFKPSPFFIIICFGVSLLSAIEMKEDTNFRGLASTDGPNEEKETARLDKEEMKKEAQEEMKKEEELSEFDKLKKEHEIALCESKKEVSALNDKIQQLMDQQNQYLQMILGLNQLMISLMYNQPSTMTFPTWGVNSMQHLYAFPQGEQQSQLQIPQIVPEFNFTTYQAAAPQEQQILSSGAESMKYDMVGEMPWSMPLFQSDMNQMNGVPYQVSQIDPMSLDLTPRTMFNFGSSSNTP
jgi:hypothetical protein